MNRYESTIESLLLEAEIAAHEQRESDAAQRFQTLRTLLVEGIDVAVMSEKMMRVRSGFSKEAKRYNEVLSKKFDSIQGANGRVIILSDSLALPRPLETKQEDFGLMLAYPYWLQEKLLDSDIQVQSWGQRYMTSELLLREWETIKEHFNGFYGAFLVIHLGLNDYVERVFLEEERIALEWLPLELNNKIVEFGQKFRNVLMKYQDDYAYVPSKQFKNNIEKIVIKAHEEGVKGIYFVNQIALPMNRWKHTLNYMFNFNRCNLVFYDMAKKHSVDVIDLDRLAWINGLEKLLNEDLMHLGLEGHKLLANAIYSAVKN